MSAWEVTEADYARPRRPGIAGVMRLKDEAEFLDRAFETHLPGLDELIVVHNRCTDETPAICARWATRYPEKITVFEYEPEVVPLGAAHARRMDPRDEHSLAGYYNWSFTRTTREIVIKVDGDHVGDPGRFARTCARVRRRLTRDEFWPTFGLNLGPSSRGVGVYNLYGFCPTYPAGQHRGPAPFTGGDHCFFYADARTRHITDPLHGYEKMELAHKRTAHVTLSYLFFHLKGLKRDRGTSNWFSAPQDRDAVRAAWAERTRAAPDTDFASFGAMEAHNPQYFREADPKAEFCRLFPDLPIMPDPPLPFTPGRVLERLKSGVGRLGLLPALGLEK